MADHLLLESGDRLLLESGDALLLETLFADLPLIDDSEVFAPSIVQDQTLALPLLDGGWPFGPTVTGTVTAGLAVYLVVDAGDDVLLEPVTTPTFRDPIDDLGSFTVTLANDDADLALCTYESLLRFEVDGIPVFSGIIRGREKVHLAAGEEHDHVTALTGPGLLGVATKDVIYPSRGVEVLPIEVERSWSWVSSDFDHTTWPFAKKVNRQRAYASWAGPFPYVWPDPTAWWIWADLPSVSATDAPSGFCLFHKDFTLAADAKVRIFAAADNTLRLYLDGAEVQAFTMASRTGETFEIDLTAGDHHINARCLNSFSTPSPNPGGFICAVYTVAGENDLLDELVVHTDHTWRCLPYPVRAPGFTVGEILYLLRDETDIFDAYTFDFTETLDSGGVPWAEHREITIRVGRQMSELFRELAAAYCDIAAAPGAKVIRAWNYGTRGTVRAASLDQTPGDPDASEFLGLRHIGHAARLNKALILDAEGWTEHLDTASITAHGTAGGFLEMGTIAEHDRAQDIAATVMERRAEPFSATEARLLPSGDATDPYRAFEVGDTIDCLDEDDNVTAARVRGISLQPDENGVLEWEVELRDIELEAEELYANWLKRQAPGIPAGGARITSPAGAPPPVSRQITSVDVAEFSMHSVDGTPATGLGIKRRAVRTGNAVEIVVVLTLADDGVPTTSATTLRVYLDGVVLGSLITIAAGEDEAELPLSLEPIIAYESRLRPELVSVAAEVAGVDVQVKAI